MQKKICFWFGIGILSLFLSCLCTEYDYDLFARLIVGEQFVEHCIIHIKDFLSYTPTHFWYDHEWGSGVVFYCMLKFFGPFGLILLQALIFFFISFFIVKIQQLQKNAPPISIIFMAVFLVLFCKQNPALVRCQSFSFLFFSIFLYFLEKDKKYESKLIWLIPLIVIFWNNLHGGVVSGLGLVVMYLLGAIIERKPWKKYLQLLIISTPILIVNPYGIKYLKFLFSAATMSRKYIVEWWPFYAYRHFLYYLPMTLYVIFGFALKLINSLKKKNFEYTKLIVLSATLFEGLMHVKLLSLTLIAVAALCYNEIFYLFGFMRKILKKIEKSLYLAVFIIAFSIPLYSPTCARVTNIKFPIYEVEFLKTNNIKGNVLANFGFGSYISYKLYPDNLIYMDGRYEEVYNEKEYLSLKEYELGYPDWKNILNNYETQIVLANNNTTSYLLMQNNSDWSLVYKGRLCGVFVKKENIQKKYIEPDYDINYYKKTNFDGYFGNKIRKKRK